MGIPNAPGAKLIPPPLCGQLLMHSWGAAARASPVNTIRKKDQDRWAREKPQTWGIAPPSGKQKRLPAASLVSGKNQRRHKSLRILTYLRRQKTCMQKTIRHWRRKLKMVQTHGERHHVLGLEESTLWKWLYYPKQSKIGRASCRERV